MFPGMARLKRHIRQCHEDYKPLQCEKCPLRFFNKERLTYHILAHHENRRDFPCTVCGHRSVTKTYLKLHMLKHEKKADGTYKPRDPKQRIPKKEKCQVEYFAMFLFGMLASLKVHDGRPRIRQMAIFFLI